MAFLKTGVVMISFMKPKSGRRRPNLRILAENHREIRIPIDAVSSEKAGKIVSLADGRVESVSPAVKAVRDAATPRD